MLKDFIQKNIKSTKFITHDSPGIQSIRDYPELFEIGFHPNFGNFSLNVLAFIFSV